jgi:hypothetical protein
MASATYLTVERSPTSLQFQKLTDRHIAEVDKIVAGLKKATTSGGKKK